MAATGFTPIQLYRTTTASAQPSAGNLADGELAINLTDKKLYAKDASNNVFVLADASSGGTTATNLAGGAAGSVPYQTGANATTFLGIGTAAQVLQVNSGATAPEWVNTSGTGDVARTTSPSFTTPSLGAATALSINSLTLTTSTGTFTLANGKTLTVNNSLTLSGTDATTMTFPSTSATIARTDAAQSFTGTQTFLSNPVLDAGTANGVLYLDGSKVVTSGSALTFDGSTFSNVQGSGTAALSFNQLSFSRNGANYLTATLSSLNYGASQHIFGNNDLSSEWMRLTSIGLGIGTDNPTNALSVTGNANITGNTTLGDATTDAVTVNGYVGQGVSPSGEYGYRMSYTGSTATTQYGFFIDAFGSSAATVSVAGLRVRARSSAAAYTMGSAYGLFVDNAGLGAGSTITNATGLFIQDQTVGTNNFGVQSAVSSGTNKWNIYASGTANNAFAGNVRIGSTTAPTNALDVTGAMTVSGNTTLGDASTDAVTVNGKIGVNTTDTSAGVLQIRQLADTNAGGIRLENTTNAGALVPHCLSTGVL
jgi:hypothetical protein